MRIQLNNGWFGTMYDNARGNARLVEVEGYYTEIGSVYAHDIKKVFINDIWELVEHTEKQLKHKQTINAMGF